MVCTAIRDHDRAVIQQRQCQKSAVFSAWRLGGLLIEKKLRLGHGEFGPWLLTTGISTSSAADYMSLARQISDAGNLKSSIAATLRALAPPPAAPRPAGPPPAAPRPAAVQPAEKLPAARPAAVQPAPRDRIEELEQKISILEGELVEERNLVGELRKRIQEFEATVDAAA